jgi:malate synthase
MEEAPMAMTQTNLDGRHTTRLQIRGPVLADYEGVLSRPALEFLADLARAFAPRVEALLARRRQVAVSGGRPRFLEETAAIRQGGWSVAPVPAALQDRRVEITGPPDRKMIINAMNSGARVFMADFEDSLAPTWDNVVRGQQNLREAVEGTIRHIEPGTGKIYALRAPTAALMVRPRGWHLVESHAVLGDRPMPAALFDFGLYFFHNARTLRAAGLGPYFYLPKMQSHLEARLWNDVFEHAQRALGVPHGTIKATVLIETLPAAFEMDEILYELREHSAGLNCGRWDYIFSTIKTVRDDPAWVMPDRGQVTMEQPFLRAYTQLLVKTCHRRGAHAMGGMAAQIPIKDDPAANARALEKVRADKLREVGDGHDGTWVAHPGLVATAREVFDAHMPGPNQLHVRREDVEVTEADLLQVPRGTRTEAGLRQNVSVGIQYLEAWLRGSGCVPLYDLMEDAATAEISRTQIWQWVRHRATLDDGTPVTPDLCRRVVTEEGLRLVGRIGEARFIAGKYRQACDLFAHLCLADELPDFLTGPAYEQLVADTAKS